MLFFLHAESRFVKGWSLEYMYLGFYFLAKLKVVGGFQRMFEGTGRRRARRHGRNSVVNRTQDENTADSQPWEVSLC